MIRGSTERRRRVTLFLVACVLALLTIAPIVVMLSGALKPEDDVFDGRIIPRTMTPKISPPCSQMFLFLAICSTAL